MNASEFMRLYPAAFIACHRRHGGGKRLTPRQWQILAHLDRQKTVRPTELARHLGVSTTVSVSLDRLERDGVIERLSDRQDARSVGVRLTSVGEEAMLESSDLDADAVTRLMASMTSEEREEVGRGLRTLAAVLSRSQEGDE